jgi:hypothetical protein
LDFYLIDQFFLFFCSSKETSHLDALTMLGTTQQSAPPVCLFVVFVVVGLPSIIFTFLCAGGGD